MQQAGTLYKFILMPDHSYRILRSNVIFHLRNSDYHFTFDVTKTLYVCNCGSVNHPDGKVKCNSIVYFDIPTYGKNSLIVKEMLSMEEKLACDGFTISPDRGSSITIFDSTYEQVSLVISVLHKYCPEEDLTPVYKELKSIWVDFNEKIEKQ